MKISDIEDFFSELDRRLQTPVTVLLTGGAAALLYGATRVTHDIDFEIRFRPSKKRPSLGWENLRLRLSETSRVTGIVPQYAEDIDRWSAISLPTKHSRLYKKMGRIEIRILEPAVWAIGKLARYLASDVSDLLAVLRKMKQNPLSLARIWGRALGSSAPSSAQDLFRRQVEHFLSEYSHQIWGPKTPVKSLLSEFRRAAIAARNRRKK